jgi:hypothetical protein
LKVMLFGLVIHVQQAGAVIDRSGAGANSGHEEHSVGERGLSHPAMSHEHNVTQVFGAVLRHDAAPRIQ